MVGQTIQYSVSIFIVMISSCYVSYKVHVVILQQHYILYRHVMHRFSYPDLVLQLHGLPTKALLAQWLLDVLSVTTDIL